PGKRARRALAAAEAEALAGATQQASALLATAGDGPLDERESALAQRLSGLVAADARRPAEAVPLLLDAAARLETVEVALARETYVEALRAGTICGRLGGDLLRRAAEAARTAPPPEGSPGAADLLLDGLAVRFTDGYAAGAPLLKRALGVTREEDSADREVRRPGFAGRVALDLF